MTSDKIRRKLDEAVENVLEHFKGVVLAAFVTVAVLSAIVGYRYYSYSEDDPRFCASCHLMKEAYNEWQKGKHWDVVCQKCHQLSILEKNRLLIAYVLKGNQPLAQTHGREKPWKACRDCHMDNIDQGSLTMRKSYGHARHVFMQKLECKVCHAVALHNFAPDQTACWNCHKNKGVHGLNREPLSCLKCHSFSEKTPSMIPRDRCTRCHTLIPEKGPMSDFLCHQCHNPHGIKATAPTCVSKCHQKEASTGQHALHLQKGLDCMYCHKPHSWVIGKGIAKKLCGKCHRSKNPQQFTD